MGAGARRRARWFALQVLYALDLNNEEAVADALGEYPRAFDLEVDERAREFSTQLVGDVTAQQPEIDEIIQAASKNWRLERMSRVDRNILRLATCELRFTADVPVKVVINEAVELAKRFGADDSPAFVNGILDRVATQLGRDSGT